jgi:secondary thiamine-phosphate synthase enzyme
MKSFSVNTRHRTDFVPITSHVQRALDELGVQNGCITVFVPHTTAGITINENADPDVTADMALALDHMVPWDGPYRHGEGNSAAHVKASLMGASARVIVRDGRLQLGTWQGLYLCEFDGPRTRECWVAAG